MNDTTSTMTQNPTSGNGDEAQEEVQGYFITLDVSSPMAPVARMLPFATPVTGGMTVAPGEDSTIIGVLRKAGKETEVQGYGIRVPDFAPSLPTVTAVPLGAGLGTSSQDSSIIGVLRHPDTQGEVRGYGIRVPEVPCMLPVVTAVPSAGGLGAVGQDQSIIAVLTCRKAGKDQQEF